MILILGLIRQNLVKVLMVSSYKRRIHSRKRNNLQQHPNQQHNTNNTNQCHFKQHKHILQPNRRKNKRIRNNNQPADHEQKDQTNTESTEATNPTTNDSHDKTDVLDDGYGKKKVIEPLNDITKGPDLDALLAAEEKMAPIPTPPANTTVVPATPSTAAESSTPPPTETTQSDPHSDIAL